MVATKPAKGPVLESVRQNVVVLSIIGIYLALAVLFYLALTATATDASIPSQPQRPRWQRARHVKERALRRLLSLRLPRRPR